MDGIMREISVYANIQRQVSRHKKVVGPPKMAKSHFEVIDFRELWGNMISTRQRNEQASKQAGPHSEILFDTKSPSGTEISLIGFRNDSRDDDRATADQADHH